MGIAHAAWEGLLTTMRWFQLPSVSAEQSSVIALPPQPDTPESSQTRRAGQMGAAREQQLRLLWRIAQVL
ncbi:MAG: hypothetical protein ABI068_00350, partial [Ktedonobacterales bacterium]